MFLTESRCSQRICSGTTGNTALWINNGNELPALSRQDTGKMAKLTRVLVSADESLCVQSHRTFLKQRHGSWQLFTFTMPILYTHEMLQQLSKVNVFAMDIAVFLLPSSFLTPATENKPTLVMSRASAWVTILLTCDLTDFHLLGKCGCW
jgi:hypothetical protein